MGAVAVVIAAEIVLAAPSELWIINADGSGQARRFADTPGYTCGSPEWSPDGRFVAYDTWRVGQTLEDSQIVIIRADGTDARNLGIGAMPSWSPDGNQLVFHQYGRSNTSPPTRVASEDSIVVMNIDGTGRETILNHWGSPRWSPRGNRIVSILNNNLAVYDLASGIERTILPHPESMYWGFGISPDGRRLCFGGYSVGLFLAALDEQRVKATVRMLVPLGTCHYPSFAPDGRRVVFGWNRNDGKPNQLYIMNVDTGTEPELLAGQDPARSGGGPDWSPDGTKIVFSSRPVTPTAK
jgi:Tol biopolymer transport system component